MTTETPKPQHGIWTLIAPDGRQYTANSPLGCASLEMHERVPEEIMLKRILDDVLDGHEDETDTQIKIKTWDEAGSAIEHYHIQLEIGDAIGTGYCWVASLPPIIDCDMPSASGKTPFEAIKNLLILLPEKK